MNKLLAVLMFSLSTAGIAATSSVDKNFYKQAASGGMAEVEAGKLAQEKGTSEAVKSFGARMVQDHGAANEKLMGIASQKDVTLPKTLDPKHQTAQKRLQAKSGAAFDSAYIQAQIADHKAMASLMERQIKSGKDPEAKAYATETLPVVKEHLQMLQNMKSNPTGHSHSHSDLGAEWQVGAADGTRPYSGANSRSRSGSTGVSDSTRSGRSSNGSTDDMGSGSITGSQPGMGTGSNAGPQPKSRTRAESGSGTTTGTSSMEGGSNAGPQSNTGEGSITGSQPGVGTGSNAGTQARSGTQSTEPASESDIQLNMGTTTDMPAGTDTPLTNGSSTSSGSQTNQ